MDKKNSEEKVSKLFTWFHAMSLNGGPTLITATVTSYYSLFMTDTIKIPVATASIIMFIASLWDAVNDPIIGTIADRTNTKWGRYRPYFILSPVIMAIVGVLLFLNPSDLSIGQKTMYVGVTYIIYGMCYTILTMPHMAVLPAVIKDGDQRNKVVTMGGAVMAFSYIIASTFSQKFAALFGGSYVPIMVIYGVLGIAAYWGLFVTTKERYLIKAEKRPISKDMKAIFRHKELYSVLLVWCLASLGYGIMFSASVYYVMYYLVRPDLIGIYMGIISVGALVSMMVVMPIVLKIFKNGKNAFMVTQCITLVCYVILFVFGKNLTILFSISFISTATGAMANVLVNILVNDTIDFIQLKEGVSLNGTISSLKGFAQKCGTTINTSGILALLAATGYVANAVGHQPESALIAINVLRFGIPALTCLIIIVCLKFYPLEKHYKEIEKMKENMSEDTDDAYTIQDSEELVQVK